MKHFFRFRFLSRDNFHSALCAGREAACADVFRGFLHRYVIVFVLAAVSQSAFWVSCTRVGLEYPASTESYVVIQPAEHSYALPGLEYHFYNKDMQTGYFTLSCDGRGTFSGYLPHGEYTVLATNTNAGNVNFAYMDNRETATVQISGTSPSSQATGSYLASPEEIYSLTLEELSVSGTDTLYYATVPSRLTRKLVLNFTLKGDFIEDITGLSGEVNGLYRSVHLHSGQPTEESIYNSPDMATTFMADAAGSGKWRSETNLFGLHDPGYGDNYRNSLQLALIFSSGSTLPLELELTGLLSDIITQNQGVLPMTLPLHVQIERTGLGLIASVVPWDPSGGGEAEIPEEG